MLVASFVLRPLFGHAPNLALHDLDTLFSEPVASIAQILTLERQPYLSAVLPMYALFALVVPLILPLARSKPWLLLGLSLALWAFAPQLGEYMPSVDDNLWDFNPSAWQLMFVLGVIVRCQPIYQRVSANRFGWAVIAGMAYYKLLVLPPALDSAFKRDLAGGRVVNFLAIAWIAANLARYGVVKQIAARLPWVGRGRARRHGVLRRGRGHFAHRRFDSLHADRRPHQRSGRSRRRCRRHLCVARRAASAPDGQGMDRCAAGRGGAGSCACGGGDGKSRALRFSSKAGVCPLFNASR